MNELLKRWCIWAGIIIVVVILFLKPNMLMTIMEIIASLWITLWGIGFTICAFSKQGLITTECPPKLWERIFLFTGGMFGTCAGIIFPFRNSGYYIVEIVENILFSVMTIAIIVSCILSPYFLIREYYTAKDSIEKSNALLGIITLVITVIVGAIIRSLK